jgi:hypothetical protein
VPARDGASSARSARTSAPRLSSPSSISPDKHTQPALPRMPPEPRSQASDAQPRKAQEPRSVPAGTRTPSTQPGAAVVDTRTASTAPRLPGVGISAPAPPSVVYCPLAANPSKRAR